MNKNHSPIAFNKARGVLLTVPETLAIQGKTTGNANANFTSKAQLIATVRPVTFALWAAIGLLLWPTLGQTQIVADPSAAAHLRPTVINAANGVPLINIQTPSAAGVSRNLYSQFDVKSQGAILNNANANVRTQLGGWVEGNPWLATGSARIILNEVNSSNPSLLQGYVEVAGTRAQVVIANPAGIACDGCGFINANRATLTTGTPVLNSGSLDGFRVQRGVISVSGAGLDASTTDYTDLIARAVQVNAGIWAQQLKVTAGANEVNAAHTSATPIAGTGDAPTVAIDVALLGGMYASKITLVGTEAGVGVRNAGNIAASAGELIVTADGRLENAGTLTSTGHTQIDAQAGIRNSGTVYAQGNTTLSTSGNVDNSGVIAAQGGTTVRATGAGAQIHSAVGAAIVAGLDPNGTLRGSGDLSLSASDAVVLSGQAVAGGNASVVGTKINIANGTLQAGNTLTVSANDIDNASTGELIGTATRITAANNLTNRGLIDGQDNQLNAAILTNVGTGRIYGDHLSIAAGTLSNDVEAADGMTTAAVIIARNRLDIGAQTINNREHSLLFSAGDAGLGGSLNADRQAVGQVNVLNNASATIEALGNMSLGATQLNNTNEHFTYETRATSVENNVREDLGASGYRVFTRTTSGPVATSSDPAQILAGGNLTLNIGAGLNYSSHIVAGGLVNNLGVTLATTDVQATQTVHDLGTTYSVVHVPDSGYCGAIKFHCVHAHDEWTEGPYDSTAEHTVPVGQITPAHSVGTTAPGFSTGSVSAGVPNSSVFNTRPTGHYLIETDPRFANYRTWLSSDALLSALGIDPAVTEQRLGDGFYEQQLIRDQVAQLTGRRFLDGYVSDEAQYQALMDNAATYAKAYQLRPGVALSAEQMAQLTSDMVWLVEKTVTLKDGSTTKVLAPQLYVRVREGDLASFGALISGDSVNLSLSGGLTNSGSIAGRRVVNLTAENVHNLGRISGNDVGLHARNDLNNLGGSISAPHSLSATAGRDLKVATTTRTLGNAQSSRTNIDRVAGLYVTGGTLVAAAGRDLQLDAAAIVNAAPTGATPAGSTTLAAGRDLQLGVVTESASHHIVWDAANQRTDASRTDIGTSIQTQGDIRLQAGGDLNAKAATVTSDKGAVLATAGGSVKLMAGEAKVQTDVAHQRTGKGLFSSKTASSHDTLDQTTALGSTFSGNTATVLANQDIQLQGSNVVSTQGTLLAAQNNIAIEAAKNTTTESHLRNEKTTGLMGTGGIGITAGTQQQRVNQDGATNTAAASTVGSTEGSVNIQAGKNYSQVGSRVIAQQGDIDIAAQKVNIEEARDTSRNETETQFKQSGLTLALNSPVISAIQTAQQMKQASSETSDSRMKVLAGAAAALAAKNTYDAMPENSNPASGISLSISIGGSKSQSNTTQTSDNAAGSSVAAGGDIAIRAKGAAQNSDLTVQGSSIKAGHNVSLQADDQINLLAAQSTADQRSTNKSISGSIGLSIGSNTGFTVSASGARGNADGSDVTQANTHVEAGQQLSINSGGDTTLQGAVAKADQVSAHVGGNLRIESLQDTSQFDSKQKSIGGSVTIGPSPGGSLSASKSKVNSDYASVTEQSGIKAGDGGFQVAVAGNTDLKGGAITSTQAAIDHQANQFATGGVLTTSDIQNRASYSAKSVGISVGSSLSQSGKLAPSGTSAGFGSDSGNASSTTQAAISGIAGNQDARTGDKEAGIHKIFDADKVQKDINAQVQITQTFGREAPKAVASFAADQAKQLRAQNNEEEAKKWDEGGAYRIALHTASGALSGGASGALGVAAVAGAAPLLNELQDNIAQNLKEAGANDSVAKAAGQLIANATAVGIGAVASGGTTAGAAMALNVDANNRQLHPDEKEILRKRARAKAQEMTKDDGDVTEQVIRVLTERLYTVLADETTALLDARESQQNSVYRQRIEQTKQRGLEGFHYADEQLALMNWARSEALDIQQKYAGQPVQINGKDLIADGGKVQIFQSSAEQYKDSKLFNTIEREVALKQFAGNADREAAVSMAQDAYREGTARRVDRSQQNTLEHFSAINGGAALSTADLDIATLGLGGLAKRGVTSVVEAVGGAIGRKAGQVEAEVVAGAVAENTATKVEDAVVGRVAGAKDLSESPIDVAHAIGADYTKAGRPTGGHSLLNGDVRIVPGTETPPDTTGVYKATIQVIDPQNPGQWITKTSNSSINSMFPKDWDAARIKLEVDAAWNSASKVINGGKWSSFTPSGVKVEGFISPRMTVYPVYQP